MPSSVPLLAHYEPLSAVRQDVARAEAELRAALARQDRQILEALAAGVPAWCIGDVLGVGLGAIERLASKD